jgi:putative transposase
VTYEAVREWGRMFGQASANQRRWRRPRPGEQWHIDEGFLTINDARPYGWRAVDQDGHLRDLLVQRGRDNPVATTCFRTGLKSLTYVPRMLVTDQLNSYSAAKRDVLPSVEQRQHRYLNNRAENSHQPTRQREQRMQGCKSPGQDQRFLAAWSDAQHVRPRRHRSSAPDHRHEMENRFHTWQEVTRLPSAA